MKIEKNIQLNYVFTQYEIVLKQKKKELVVIMRLDSNVK